MAAATCQRQGADVTPGHNAWSESKNKPPRSRRTIRSTWNLPAGLLLHLLPFANDSVSPEERSHNSFLTGNPTHRSCRLSPSSVPNVIKEEVGLALNRAKPTNFVLHLLVSVALLVMVSVVLAQNNRAGAHDRPVTANGAKTSGANKPVPVATVRPGTTKPITNTKKPVFVPVNTASGGAGKAIRRQHNYIGPKTRMNRATVSTRRILTEKLTRQARVYRAKGSTRVAGDQNVPRQTNLLTTANPSANFSIIPATSKNLNPYWDGNEVAIYFASDRNSGTDSTENPNRTFNIYSMASDGSTVAQITTGGDQKLEPSVSTTSSRLAYVAGGQILNGDLVNQPVQTTGFNLFILDLKGGSPPQQLTNINSTFNFADVRHPSFAPGGSDIVFAGKLVGDTVYHIYTLNVAQGNILQYTSGPSNDYSPAWSPATVNGATIIAYTTNAAGFNQSLAPVAAAGTKATDDVCVFQPVRIRPFPKQITNFTINGKASTNRNPAWSTTRNDTRIDVPPGQDSQGNPTGQGIILLAFASSRADTDTTNPGVPNDISTNGSTDIYWMPAPIGVDPRDNSVITDTAPEAPFSAAGAYTGAHKLQTSNPEVTIDSLDKPGLTDFDPGHQSIEDYPTWPQFINSYRIAYQSNRGNNLEIWASSIIDIDAPTLLKYDEGTNEIVHIERTDSPSTPLLNRYVDPGTQVNIKVRAVDYQSGIKYVYVQIKCPDSAPQSFDSLEHKIFYDGRLTGAAVLTPGPNSVINAPYEWDSQAIKTSDTTNGAKFRPSGGRNTPLILGTVPNTWPGFNLYTPAIDDINAYSGINKPPDDATIPPNPKFFPDGDNGYWLRLNAETNPDGSSTGTYSATWQTPVGFQSDMLIDVIVYDNAVWPFDPTGATASNWKIYDNVWGFTTKRFNSQSQILYVNDYDTGQKFLNSIFGTADLRGAANGAGLAFNGNPTESWMTEFDANLFPTLVLPPGGIPVPLLNFLTPLGINSYGSGMFQDALVGVGTNGGPITGQYDIWRIQCRGALPASVLNIYGVRTVTQPPDILGSGTTPTNVLVADKCVIWHAPYTGDLFVGPGTLLDTDTQTQLTNFVNSGGRLFVTGQEVGFGLTLNTPMGANDFLNNTLRANYINDTAIGGLANDKLDAPTEAMRAGLHPIAFENWFDGSTHNYPDTSGYDPPMKTPPIFIARTTIPTDHDYGCPNTGSEGNNGFPIGFPNQVLFNPPADPALPAPPIPIANPPVTGKMYPGIYGIEAYYDPVNNNPAIFWYKNVTNGGKVVFSPLGWETLNPASYNVGSAFVLKNRRVELMHNVLDLLRTGRIRGTIRVKNSTGSVTSVVPGAFVRVQRPDPVTGVLKTYGTALTQNDGTFLIEGLDANGVYQLDAGKAGFATQHAAGAIFHGGYETVNDFYLIGAQPGSVSGTITTQGNNQPVPGAIVTATYFDPANPTGASPLTFISSPSDTNGHYVITNIPANTITSSYYTLTVSNLAAIGYSGSIPPSIKVTLSSSQALTGQNFALTQPPGTVSGKVVVADANGNPTTTPIPGATVTASIKGSADVLATTIADGTYSLTLTPGVYTLVASAPGFSPSLAVSVTVVSAKALVNINFALKAIPPGSISGLVTTSPPLSLPVGGATVVVTDATGKVITVTTGAVQTVTLADGSTYKFNYSVPNVSAGATVTVTASHPGYTPKPNPDTQTVAVTTGMETRNVNFILDPLFTYDSTLTLASSPYEYANTSIAALFGVPSTDVNNTFAFVAWDATAQKYVFYPTAPADTFHLGLGYFLQETNSLITLALTNPNGAQAPKDTTGNYLTFPIPLKNGWNLIGDPFTNSVDLAKLQIQESNGTLLDVPTAQAGGSPVIGSALFTYQSGSYQITYTLDPFRGYWLRAYQPCTLLVTAGAQQARGSGAAHRALEIASVANDGWNLKLTAQAGDGVSGNANLGVSRRATDAYDQFKLQSPPAATKQNVQIAFAHTDWGDKSADYHTDIRSPNATSWTFNVTSTVPNTPVTLAWPNVAKIPRHEDMILVDLDTNQTISLRNRSSIVIPSAGTALIKHYRLDVKRSTPSQELQLTSLSVVQSSGNRAAGTPVGISYNLSSDATVQISIMQGARHIRTLSAGGTRAAGLNQASWDLKTDQGSNIPAGVYTVEVKAVHPVTGRIVRQSQPVLVTR